MATHDYVIDNSTGANVRADINLVLQAILTNNSSSSAPSTTAAYMWWADTTNGVLKIRNSSNNDWVELLQLDGTLTLEDGSASTPALAFRDDLDTGIFSSASNTFNIATGGVERVEFGTATIFNDTGADVDLRIEGDTDQNLLFCNAGGNAVGIGTSTPGSKLHIFQSSASAATGNSGAGLSLESNSHQYIQYLGANNKEQGILFGDDADNDVGSIVYNHSDNKLTFATAANMRLMIDSSGRLLLGTTTEGHSSADDFTIATSGNTGITIRSGTSNTGNIYFSDATSGNAEYSGYIEYDHSSNFLRFGAATAEAMRIDSNGDVGIGTTNPGQRLEVRQTDASHAIIACNRANSDTFAIALGNNSSHNGIISVNATDLLFGEDNAGTFSEFMRLDSSGSLGVGESSPDRKLHISGGTFPALRIKNTSTSIANGTNICGVEFEHADSSAPGVCAGIQANMADTSQGGLHMLFLTGTNVNLYKENMRLDANGRLLIQETTTADVNANLTVAVGGASLAGIVTHSGTTANRHALACCNDNGHIGGITTSGSTTSFNTSSDYRLKENATAISDGISRLKTLKPYRFNWKVDSSTTVDGFFAHEVTAVPEAITGTKDEVVTQAMIDAGDYEEENLNDPIYQGIDQSKLVPLLVAAVQELITKVETLEAA